jgi:hypothetical protein
MDTNDIVVDNTAVTKDPIEVQIIKHIKKLQMQNSRMHTQIQKTSSWLHIKDIKKWSSYDFYNYFCIKFSEKYNKEYRNHGNITKSYAKIDDFLSASGISNEVYREFIDLAFSRYFNSVVLPMLGNMCSLTLFKSLCGKAAMKADNTYAIDAAIMKESEKFEKSILETGGVTYGSQRKGLKKVCADQGRVQEV